MAPGDVAQLARALDWQSRGRRFESALLHKSKHFTILLEQALQVSEGFFLQLNLTLKLVNFLAPIWH